LQSLLGSINWIRPNLGISTDDLQPLFQLLRGDPNLNSPRSLTPEATEALTIVQRKLISPTVSRRWVDVPPVAFLFRVKTQPFAAVGQYNSQEKDIIL
ncbi:POK19 protein, partial [Sclerurus mexicanus]|nr:POK19 protein [Sclerurus mexicanus]